MTEFSTHDRGRKHRVATYHLDVQFAFRVVNWGQRLQEGKHDWLGAGPAADQQANFHPLFIPHSPQLGVNVCPVPAEGAKCSQMSTTFIYCTQSVSQNDATHLDELQEFLSALKQTSVVTSHWLTVPFSLCELHGGQVVHDCDVDEALGILHDTEDGLEILSPASCTEGWWGTLTEWAETTEIENRCLFRNESF